MSKGDGMKMMVKLRRIEKGLKQYELADKVGISRQYLRLIENGEAKNPSIEIMKRISQVLQESVEKLFFL